MEKLSMNLDDLQVESFDPEPEAVKESVEGYYGTNHTQNGCAFTETTCMERVCACSAFPTDCDWTCPGYWNAVQATCACE